MPDVAALSVSIGVDDRELTAGLARAGQSVNSFGSTIQAALGGALIGATAAVGAGFAASVKSAADFEKQMSAVGAVAGASASEMDALTKAALQLGKDTSFSASEAAQGIEELVKAGVSVADVMGGGARAALDLAAAGAVSVADAAEIASNAMNVFGLKGADMAHVADVIAGAANASAIGVNDYKFSLSAAGAVAATVGISFESLSEAIAVMGNAGIKGSDAGTSLKTMLMNLSPTTKSAISQFKALGIITADGANQFFDATGKAKGFGEIAQILQESLKGLTKEQQLVALEIMFGSDAIRAAAVMAEAGAAGFTEMAEAMSKVTAQSVANERLNNLWGSVEKLKGSLETAAIILGGQFTPALKRMADGATDAVNSVIDAFEQIPDAVETVRQVIASEWAPDSSIRPFTLAVGEAAVMVRDMFGPAITAVAAFVTGTLIPGFQAFAEPIAAFVAGFTGAITAAGLFTAAVTAVATVLGFLLSPLGLVAVAVGLLAAAWTTNFMGIQEATAAAWAAIQPVLMELVAWLGERIPPVLEWISNTGWPAMVMAGQSVAEFITGTLIPGITELIDWLGPKLQPVVEWLSGTGWPALVTASQEVHRVGLLVIQFVKDLWVELEKRGIVEAVTKAFTDLHAILQPVFNVLTLIVGVAGQVIGFLADLALKGLESGAAVQVVATQIERFFAPIASGLDSLAKFIAMLRSLGEIKIPSFSLPGFGGGGATQMSWTGAGLADPNASGEQIDAYIRSAGQRRGMSQKDIDDAIRVSRGERDQNQARSVGDGGQSYGVFQLYTGGGLGNVALNQGLDVRDPRTWQQQVEFALDQAISGGWEQWSAARDQGIRGRPQGTTIGVPNIGDMGDIKVSQAQWGASVGMTPQEAAAACGPYAAYLFAQATGRTPNPAEAEQLARAAGWNEAGMGGTGNFMNLLGRMGVNAVRTGTIGMSSADITAMAAQSGSMTGFSTPGHYFASTGFDPSNGKFNVGATGTFAGGETWMTVAQMSALMGPIQDIVTLGGQMGATFGVAGRQVTDGIGIIPPAMTTAGTAAQALGTTYDLMAAGVTKTVTDMGGQMVTKLTDASGISTTTVTDMTGAVLSQMTTLKDGTVLQMGDMANGVLTSSTSMGTGFVTAVTDMAGNTITTVTDMHGQVTQQFVVTATEAVAQAGAQATGVTAQYAAMGAQVMADTTATSAWVQEASTQTGTKLISDVTNMAGITVERYREMNGEVVTIVTDQNGKVIADFTRTAEEVAGISDTSATKLITTVTDSMGRTAEIYRETSGEIVTIWTDASGNIIGEFEDVATASKLPIAGIDSFKGAMSSIEAPDFGDIVSEFKSVEKAARSAISQLDKFKEHTGYKSGSGKNAIKGFAEGGWVGLNGPELAWLGERGPEYVVPNHALRSGGGGGGDTYLVTVEVNGALLANDRHIEEAVVRGLESAKRRGRA